MLFSHCALVALAATRCPRAAPLGVRALSMCAAPDNLAALTVPQLKERLRSAGLPVSGRKAVLIERLGGAAAAPSVEQAAPPAAEALVAIEFCRSWGAFKTRANKLAASLEGLRPGLGVSLNVEKPRKGVFEVRVGGTPVLTTGPEPRPFPDLKAIDLDALSADVLDAVGSAGEA